MKRKITSFILCLAMLVSVIAVLPLASAAADTTLAGTDVTLTDGIILNFYIEADEALGIDNAPLVDGYYVVTKALAAKEMGDDVTVELKNGETVVGEYTYSVADYAAGIIAGNYSDTTKALVTAMLNYGAAAQKYFNYDVENLVGTPVSDTAALLAAEVEDAVINDESEIFIGASLVLEGTMKLRFYFKGNDLDVTIGGNDVEKENRDGYCYVETEITPDQIDDTFEIIAQESVISYSPLNYLKSAAQDPALAEIAASIYAYSVAAEAYIESLNYEIEVVTTTTKEEHVIMDYVQIKDIIGDKHFYPTDDDPDGNDLYVEFSILFNDSMKNFQGTNITFPGIYSANTLASNAGAPAFWYYIKTADGITAGKYDDWTSNAVNKNDPAKYFNNMAKPVEFDGWHRFGVKFHQNTDVDIANDKVSYTVTVTMYIDGVRVYEAELDAMNSKKDNSHYLRLYEAQIVDGDVVYTDNVDSFASYYRYTAYVADANNPAYFVTTDKYITVGDSFVLDVERVDNPADATLVVEDGTALSAKTYYSVK